MKDAFSGQWRIRQTAKWAAKHFFTITKNDQIVWATYSGGSVVFGALVAKLEPDGSLEMRYEHVNSEGEFMTGKCRSVLNILPDGRYQLNESWQWTCGDHSKGVSVIEEIPN